MDEQTKEEFEKIQMEMSIPEASEILERYTKEKIRMTEFEKYLIFPIVKASSTSHRDHRIKDDNVMDEWKMISTEVTKIK